MTEDKVQKNLPERRRRYWVLGAGRFGRLAVERIRKQWPDADLTVVDIQPVVIDQPRVNIVHQEGVAWLKHALHQQLSVDMIIPSIPVHVCYEWIRLNLKEKFDILNIELKASWLTQLPRATVARTGRVYVSHADFICPDSCSEPSGRCTHTGQARPTDLFRLVAELDFDKALPIVVRSHQLLPGVGGIHPGDLRSAVDTARQNPHRNLMLATACRCHGVIDFLRLTPKGRSGD